jgi:septal ring factor EnvC (AmiA/AmiB activator)
MKMNRLRVLMLVFAALIALLIPVSEAAAQSEQELRRRMNGCESAIASLNASLRRLVARLHRLSRQLND